MYQELITSLRTSKTVQTILWMAVGVGVYAILPVIKEYSPYAWFGDSPSEIHAALTLALGWLLVFRTNAAYSRWWEARTAWGSMINATRNLSMKLSVLTVPQPSDIPFLSRLLSDFPRALMHHLRKTPYTSPAIPLGTKADHIPLAISNQLYAWVSSALSENRIDSGELKVIDSDLSKLMDVCGACERIARTPIVLSYRIFARQCIFLYLLTLPWGIVDDFKWWTIPMTIIMAYFMIGMEVVAEHVEEPFGYDEDDLDLEGMCETIEASVSQVLSVPHQSNN
jgi:ion channel-forming bestrophin family protein